MPSFPSCRRLSSNPNETKVDACSEKRLFWVGGPRARGVRQRESRWSPARGGGVGGRCGPAPRRNGVRTSGLRVSDVSAPWTFCPVSVRGDGRRIEKFCSVVSTSVNKRGVATCDSPVVRDPSRALATAF